MANGAIEVQVDLSFDREALRRAQEAASAARLLCEKLGALIAYTVGSDDEDPEPEPDTQGEVSPVLGEYEGFFHKRFMQSQ